MAAIRVLGALQGSLLWLGLGLITACIRSAVGQAVSAHTVQKQILAVVGIGYIAHLRRAQGREVIDEVVGIDKLEVLP